VERGILEGRGGVVDEGVSVIVSLGAGVWLSGDASLESGSGVLAGERTGFSLWTVSPPCWAVGGWLGSTWGGVGWRTPVRVWEGGSLMDSSGMLRVHGVCWPGCSFGGERASAVSEVA
jgi:hypothetical protein